MMKLEADWHGATLIAETKEDSKLLEELYERLVGGYKEDITLDTGDRKRLYIHTYD